MRGGYSPRDRRASGVATGRESGASPIPALGLSWSDRPRIDVDPPGPCLGANSRLECRQRQTRTPAEIMREQAR